MQRKMSTNEDSKRMRVPMLFFSRAKQNLLSLCANAKRKESAKYIVFRMFGNFFIFETMLSAIFQKSARVGAEGF